MFFYEDLFKALKEDKIEYVVVGGLALVLHGVVRLTADLDLIVALKEDNINKFAKMMTRLGYKPKAPVPAEHLGDAEKRKKWLKEKNMKVFSFFHQKEHFKLVDVFVTEPIPFKELSKEKKNVKVNDISIPICSIGHLIELKEKAGRPQDVADIKALKKIKREE